MGKENHLEGLSKAGLVVLDLLLGFGLIGLEGRCSTTELPPQEAENALSIRISANDISSAFFLLSLVLSLVTILRPKSSKSVPSILDNSEKDFAPQPVHRDTFLLDTARTDYLIDTKEHEHLTKIFKVIYYEVD